MCPNELVTVDPSREAQRHGAPWHPAAPAGAAVYAMELLDPHGTDVVLDLGCGDGAVEYHFLKDHVHGFHGMDPDPEAVTRASQWLERWTSSHPEAGAQRWSFRHANDGTLPFQDGSFTKALCLGVLEGVNSRQHLADELHRVLRPDATLVISSSRRHCEEGDLRRLFHRFHFDVVHRCGTPVSWALHKILTMPDLPAGVAHRLSAWTAPLTNLDYRTRLPTGFNIMVKLRKPA